MATPFEDGEHHRFEGEGWEQRTGPNGDVPPGWAEWLQTRQVRSVPSVVHTLLY